MDQHFLDANTGVGEWKDAGSSRGSGSMAVMVSLGGRCRDWRV